MPFEPTPSRGVVPSYAAAAQAPSGASTNENNDGLIPSNSPLPTPPPSVAPLPLPGAAAQPDTASVLLPVLYGTGAVLFLGLLLASPHLARGALRRRRLAGSAAGSSASSAWAELRDLATDYGVAPQSSETPRHFSERLRRAGALGEPQGLDADGHQAVRSLTADFERRQYGRPPSGPGAGGVESGAAPDAATAAGSAAGRTGVSAAPLIAAVHDSLRAHARPFVRFRAEWLPPSVLAAWRRAATAPFRAARRTAQRTRRGLAAARSRAREALRRVRRQRWRRRS